MPDEDIRSIVDTVILPQIEETLQLLTHQQFLCYEPLVEFERPYPGYTEGEFPEGGFPMWMADPLPESHAVHLEMWAYTVHHKAAFFILWNPLVFPPGSIGEMWARKILGPEIQIVKEEPLA